MATAPDLDMEQIERACPLCSGPLIEGEEHLHIGQVRADSASWTGREREPWAKALRVKTALWAKIYVWARYRLISALCRATGGHEWSWMLWRCENCGLAREWVEDWGERPALSRFIRCHAVVL